MDEARKYLDVSMLWSPSERANTKRNDKGREVEKEESCGRTMASCSLQCSIGTSS